MTIAYMDEQTSPMDELGAGAITLGKNSYTFWIIDSSQ